MRFLKFSIPLLIFAAVGIFVYGTLEDPGRNFIFSRLVPVLEKEPAEPISIIFVGDIMMDRGVGEMIERYGNGSSRYPFLNIANTLQGADLTIGNLEGPISSRGKRVGSVYSFRHPVERVDGLKFAGFDILSLANNHIWDYGADALVDTVDILKNSGIAPVGTGRNFEGANAPFITEVKGTKIAFLSYTNLYPASLWAGNEAPGVSTPETLNIRESIASIRDSTDLVVVLFHWGEEYQSRASGLQRSIARSIIDAGADLVVGTHPHVTQEIETYEGKTIAYSLGNFVFDQGFSENTMRSHMFQVVVRDKKIVSAVPFPVRLNKTFQPELGWRTIQLLENLPFQELDPPVELVEGFTTYEGALGDPVGNVHRGIDYARRDGRKLLPFNVFSMHAGTAMQGISQTWGEFVMVRYVASLTFRYYTIYSHLADVPEKFPDLRNAPPGQWVGVPVTAGEFLGLAGTSGNTKGETQLHIEIQEHDLETDQWLKLDPYGVYDRASAYPRPSESLKDLDHYWETDNPAFAK